MAKKRKQRSQEEPNNMNYEVAEEVSVVDEVAKASQKKKKRNLPQ